MRPAGCAQRNRQVCAGHVNAFAAAIVEVGEAAGDGYGEGTGGRLRGFEAEQAGDVSAQRREVSEAVQAGDEQSGVDGAGDGRVDRHDGYDGHPGHVCHVSGGEAAPRLGDGHDPVRQNRAVHDTIVCSA